MRRYRLPAHEPHRHRSRHRRASSRTSSLPQGRDQWTVVICRCQVIHNVAHYCLILLMKSKYECASFLHISCIYFAKSPFLAYRAEVSGTRTQEGRRKSDTKGSVPFVRMRQRSGVLPYLAESPAYQSLTGKMSSLRPRMAEKRGNAKSCPCERVHSRMGNPLTCGFTETGFYRITQSRTFGECTSHFCYFLPINPVTVTIGLVSGPLSGARSSRGSPSQWW